MEKCDLTSFSPDGIEARGASHIKELMQKAVCSLGQIHNQLAVSRTFNIQDRWVIFPFAE